jgi:hypothetical protein
MNIMRPAHEVTTVQDLHYRKISWPAIFGGVVVGIVIALLLNLLGTGIGFAAFTPDMEKAKALGATAMIWMFVSAIISMFAAGWIASSLSGVTDAVKGYWQGFIVAGLTALLMLYIASSAVGSIISSSFSLLGNLTTASGTLLGKSAAGLGQAANAMSNHSKDDVMQKAKDMLPEGMAPSVDQLSYDIDTYVDSANQEVASQTSSTDTDAQVKAAKAKAELYKSKVMPALFNLIESINTDNYDQARKNFIDAVSQASGKPATEVEAKVDEWQKSFQAAKDKAIQKAKDAAEKSAALVSRLALINFLVILLSVVSAGMGGVAGARRTVKKINVTETY